MTNVLEAKGNLGQSNLCSQEIIMVILQLLICIMIPSEDISDELSNHVRQLEEILTCWRHHTAVPET